jgi:hypothetical protein
MDCNKFIILSGLHHLAMLSASWPSHESDQAYLL